MRAPCEYKTIGGLARATEKVLMRSPLQKGSIAGCSRSMWLHNAKYVAETNFKNIEVINALQEKYAITRPQDLEGGSSVFGIPLPTRSYAVGDNVPGVGKITDQVDTPHGKQFFVGGQWVNENCLG